MISNFTHQACKKIMHRIAPGARTLLLLIFISSGHLYVNAAWSQNNPINLKLQEVSLKVVLQEIEKQCDFTFAYNASNIDVDQLISVSFENETLDAILIQLLAERNIAFEYVKEKIVLTPANTNIFPVVSPQNNDDGKKITGTVTDASDGSTLPGVSIIIKGTTTGTVTDIDGKYSLEVPDDITVLVFSYLGYEKVEALTDRNVIDIAMVPAATQLEEMVVVGYGTQSKKLLTGAISAISNKSLEGNPVSNIDLAIQGKSTGVQVVSNSGTPGAGISVRVRGISSINAGSDPLYVVDGIPIITGDYGQVGFSGQTINAISDINPNDIESISVLKDASAATIYGTRASNGVILITTKKGASSKTKFNFSTYYGLQKVAKTLDMLNATEYMEFKNDASVASGGLPVYSQEQIDNNTIDTDWFDEVLRVAPIANYELSASGGSKDTRFYISGNYFDQQGTLIGTAYDRLNGRVNIDHTVNDRLTIGSNIGISYSRNDRKEGDQSLNSPMANAIAMPAIYPVYNEDGSFNDDGPFANPVSIGKLHTNKSYAFRSIANMYADVKIAEGLIFQTKWGADYYNLREHTYDPPTTRQGGKYNGLGIATTANVSNIVSNNVLKYTGDFNDRHHINALLGYSFENYSRRSSYLRGQDFPSEDFQYIASAATITEGSTSALDRGLNSFFGEIKYDLSYKYLFSLSGRYDGSSKFGANNKFGFFPAGSAAWRISEEDFFDFKSINELKLRASYGLTGNDGIPDFAFMNLYSSGSNYLQAPGIYPSQLPNPDLRWETTTQFDLGFDLTMFDSRMTLNFDYYNKHTRDLLLSRPVPASSGFSSLTSNIGEMKNDGIEILLSTNIIQREFTWDLNTNFSLNRNEVTKLYDDQPVIVGRGENNVRVGYPIGIFYNYESLGVDPSTGDLVFRDVDGDGIITENDQTLIGDPNPDFIGGLTNNFAWNGLSLSVFIQYSYGNDIFNGTRRYVESMKGQDNQLTTVLERWQEPGDVTSVPRATNADLNNNDRVSSRFVEDGSYLRFKNVRLSYSFPKNILDKMHFDAMQIFAMAQNLFTFTNYSGMDPEVNYAGNDNLRYGTDFFTYPNARTFTVGLNVQF